MASCCEVRTPTYNRPVLLARALVSLQAQTDANWVCRVFDDSTDERTADLCRALADPRIRYQRNAVHKGARGNIDQCFARGALAGPTHFFVLEDDNYVLPDFIAANIAAMEASGAPVLLRNQRVETYAEGDGDGQLSEMTCLGLLFTEGTYPAAIARTGLLFGGGLSNGGVFWRSDAQSDFETRVATSNATLDEQLRAYLIRDRVQVAMEPLAVWRQNGPETTRGDGKRKLPQNFVHNQRALQQLRRAVFDSAMREAGPEAVTGPHLAASPQAREAATLRLLRRWPSRSALSARRKAGLLAKGLALSLAPSIPGISGLLRARPL